MDSLNKVDIEVEVEDEVDVVSSGSEVVAFSPSVFAEESRIVIDLVVTTESFKVVILLVFIVVVKFV